MSDIDRESVRREKEAKAIGAEAEPVSGIYNPLGWTGDQCVRNWCDQVLEAIRCKVDKLPRFHQATHHDLLMCNDADVLLLPGREREQAFDMVASKLLTLAYHSDTSAPGGFPGCHSRAWLPREESRSFRRPWQRASGFLARARYARGNDTKCRGG